MNVIVNGHPMQVDSKSTIAQVIEQLQLPNQRVAVELNQAVIPRSQWSSQEVKEGDQIEVVQFVGGGTR